MNYNISEIFYSIQGEGLFQGIPGVFIRFAGCNLRCFFCDTKYAWDGGKEMDEKDILEEIRKFNCKRIFLTGGEPYLQDIAYLYEKLKTENFWVGIETNGTIFKDVKFDWITVSPKKEGEKFHKFGYDERFKKIANEFKYIIVDESYFDFIDRTIEKPVILQPVDNNNEVSKKIIKFLKENNEKNWFLRMQLHKILNIK
jgi:organic radical activating enzyme